MANSIDDAYMIELRLRIEILEDQVRRLENALQALAEIEAAPDTVRVVKEYLFEADA